MAERMGTTSESSSFWPGKREAVRFKDEKKTAESDLTCIWLLDNNVQTFWTGFGQDFPDHIGCFQLFNIGDTMLQFQPRDIIFEVLV